MKLPQVDVVVVGAGASGGIVAEQLARAGRTVALLERGRVQKFSETGHDELRSQRTTVLGNAFGPDDERYVRLMEVPGKADRKVLPSEGAYNNVAACVGGGTLSYGAMAWRFMERDFRMRSSYGAPEGSSMEDWPIGYNDLEQYYTKAEWEIGVSGKRGANAFEPPRHSEYPMPPLPLGAEASILYGAAQRLNWHPFPIPMAINSVPYQGRAGCVFCAYCVGFACEAGAKSSTAVTVIPRAIATGNCRLETEAVAKRIATDNRSNASAVEYYRGGVLYEQPCKTVVVCCSATETPRLLFNSANKLFPRGLGNNNGWVGRNLQGHAYAGAYGVFDHEIYDGLGPGARVACCDFNHGLPNGLKGGSMIANEFVRLPYLYSQAAIPPEVPRWGSEHKRYMKRHYKRTVAAQGPVQEMPVFESGVDLAPGVRDAWGIPTIRIRGHRHPHDLEVAKFIAEKCESWLREAGATRTWQKLPGSGASGGQHQVGTCRMGNDRKTSVVDADCRIHGIDNIYIADGSVFVNNGGFNPSLTIQANAYRVAAKLVTMG